MGIKCDIKFHQNPLKIFHAGSAVSGVALVNFDRSRKIVGVRLQVVGFATCEWKETEKYQMGRKKVSRAVTFKGREEYLESNTNLLGYTSGSVFKVNAGIQTFDFSCVLPQCVPSSFEGGVGHIRYLVKVLVDKQGKNEPEEFSSAFTVIKDTDLNASRSLLSIPVRSEAMRQFCCWPCKTGPLAITVTLPRTGFVPGETIPITVSLNNETSYTIDEVSLKVQQKIRYISQIPYQAFRTEERVVARLKGLGTGKKENRTDTHELVILSVPPTNVVLCSVIQISYLLVVRPKVSGIKSKDLTLEIPITIGTVPIIDRAPRPAPSAPSDLDQTNESLFDLPPPKYEEAIFFEGGEVESSEGPYFVPRYPVFSPSAPPQNHNFLESQQSLKEID